MLLLLLLLLLLLSSFRCNRCVAVSLGLAKTGLLIIVLATLARDARR